MTDRAGRQGVESQGNEASLREAAEAHGQGHVFGFWDELGAGERGALLKQLRQVDFALVDRLVEEHVAGSSSSQPESVDLAPAPVIAIPSTAEEKREEALARETGEALIREGKVAAFVVAGGQGTRLGFDGPKGTFEIGPVSRRSLFQLHAEKLRAISRRYGALIPLYVMTSETNHEATETYFQENDFFGMGRGNVRLFQQGMMPAVDRSGKLLLESKSRIFMSPNGHGGSLKALYESGALGELRERNVEVIFYFQVDNPLLRICDPVFLGHHARADAEMSSKVVRKSDWQEKVGVVALRGGQTEVVEYSDLSDTDAKATLADSSLKYWAGSIAVHVLSVGFVERLNEGGFRLPYHRAEKKISFVDTSGKYCEPEGKNGIKFETFVFDALPLARRVVTLEVPREEDFSPVKNATGDDSPATSRTDLTALYLRWLEACGATIERRADGRFQGFVEISPLTALAAEDLVKHVKPGTVVRDQFIL